MIHALVPWKELIRATFFIAFLVLGFRARRSQRATLTFIAYTVAASLLVGFTQQEAWPFSNWALVHTLRQHDMSRWDFIGIDASGRAWIIDPRVLEPIATEEFDTWTRMQFFRLTPHDRDVVARDLLERAEKGRQRFLAKGYPGTDRWLLGPAAAPRHFHRARIWRTPNDVPKNPFERFQIRLSEWEIENANAVKQRVLYESPVIPSVSEGSGGRAAR
jgi:hypothetical protein